MKLPSTSPPLKAARDRRPRQLPHVGWREWLELPELGIRSLKAKVDTGARTSSLHAFKMRRFEKHGDLWVRFDVHPEQRSSRHVTVEAQVIDERKVRPSTGQAQLRPVIETMLHLGGQSWPIEITLVLRDMMGFRMLLGRQAIRNRFLVDSGRSYLASTRRRQRKQEPSPP